MHVMLLGSGGREHAIGWKLSQSPRLTRLTSLPGNPGLAALGDVVADGNATDPMAVVDTAQSRGVDLVVVGPEAPLAAGVADALREAGIAVCGPSREATRLESSKAYAKEVMTAAGVATGQARAFTEEGPAMRYLESCEPPYVVKADGLAAGKGVLVTRDLAAARGWVEACLGGRFGAAGETVVIEEYLPGDEVSVFALCDGERAVALAPARDYKRLGDGDTGPNTGGMGCYLPPRDLPADLVAGTMDGVVAPVLAELASRGIPYRGFLYAGLMLTDAGPQVLEFNCRLGDPETEVLLPMLDEDFLTLVAEAATGTLTERDLAFADGAAVDVVLAAAGYPDAPQRGNVIGGLGKARDVEGVVVFHAGTADSGGGVVTAGGRVLNVVATGADLESARARAYEAVDLIEFEGMQFRKDIGL